MKKLIAIVFALVAATQLSGCMGRIETGNVGVRTNFNGTVDHKVESEGFYTAIVGHVDEYTLKQVGIELNELKPKAKDNLSLKDLDVTVFYHVLPNMIRPLVVKYTGQSVQSNHGFYYPAYSLVKSVAESESATAVSHLDSLVIHTRRDDLADAIKKTIQEKLDFSDPNTFVIDRVVIRRVLTDESIEASIRNVVNKEKEAEAAQYGVAIAESNAKANAKTAQTLTPQFLQHEYNQVLMQFAQRGGTVILDGSSSSKILNIGK